MPKQIDLTGQRFTRLVVIEPAPKHKGRTAWKCKCDCGKEVTVITKSLRNGNTRSCGCLNRELSSERYKTLTLTHGSTNTPLFHRWSGMISRCSRPSMPNYYLYGGRGISVCNEWHSFENFKLWAEANGFDESLTLDRIDPNGNYEPSNCRWATIQEQSENKRNIKLYTINGESHCMAYWSRYVGYPSWKLGQIISRHPENAQAIIEEHVAKRRKL